jgi:hypothetical protein
MKMIQASMGSRPIFHLFIVQDFVDDNIYSPQILQNKVVKDFIMPKFLKEK